MLVPAVQHESGISMLVSPPFAASLPLPKSPYISSAYLVQNVILEEGQKGSMLCWEVTSTNKAEIWERKLSLRSKRGRKRLTQDGYGSSLLTHWLWVILRKHLVHLHILLTRRSVSSSVNILFILFIKECVSQSESILFTYLAVYYISDCLTSLQNTNQLVLHQDLE